MLESSYGVLEHARSLIDLGAAIRPTGDVTEVRLLARGQELAGLLDLLVADGRARGSALALGAPIGCRQGARYMAGWVADAEADGRQALAVPGLPPFPVPYISSVLAFALVDRGALEEAEKVLQDAGTGPELPNVGHMSHVFWARSRLRLAQGRPNEALDDLLEFGRRCDSVQMYNPALPWRAEAAVLHARLGDRVAANRLFAVYAEQAERLGHGAGSRGLGPHGGSASGRATRGLQRLSDAVDLHLGCPSPRGAGRVCLSILERAPAAGAAASRRPRGAGPRLPNWPREAVPRRSPQRPQSSSAWPAPSAPRSRLGIDALTPSERRARAPWPPSV